VHIAKHVQHKINDVDILSGILAYEDKF